MAADFTYVNQAPHWKRSANLRAEAIHVGIVPIDGDDDARAVTAVSSPSPAPGQREEYATASSPCLRALRGTQFPITVGAPTAGNHNGRSAATPSHHAILKEKEPRRAATPQSF